MRLLLVEVPGCAERNLATVQCEGTRCGDSHPDFFGVCRDVVAPGRMRRRISSPRILLLDCPLEYKKGENQTNVELTREEDWWASMIHTI